MANVTVSGKITSKGQEIALSDASNIDVEKFISRLLNMNGSEYKDTFNMIGSGTAGTSDSTVHAVFDLIGGLRIVMGVIPDNKLNKDAISSYSYDKAYFRSDCSPYVSFRAGSGTRGNWYYMDCIGVWSSTSTGFTFMTRDYKFGRYWIAIGQRP